MTKVTESMIYDMAFRLRLYTALKLANQNRINDLSEREILLLELVGTTGRLSISEICNYCPRISNSTISTTITRLWKEKKLVDKNILPENQRITTVNLTDKGQQVLEEIKKKQSDVFNAVTASLALSTEQRESVQSVLKSAIGFFDELLGLELKEPPVIGG